VAGSGPVHPLPAFSFGERMNSNAILIQQPAIDFPSFLLYAEQALGYSPGVSSDSSPLQLHDSEKFMSCLAAMKNQNAPVGLPPHLLTHVSFSILACAEERDMQDVLEYCSGMPFVTADTVARGVQITVITGTLAQWRDAVIAGCQPHTEPSVRVLFNCIQSLFIGVNLDVWKDCKRKQVGHTFLLEDHRDRI
jgi:hypothetical protein